MSKNTCINSKKIPELKNIDHDIGITTKYEIKSNKFFVDGKFFGLIVGKSIDSITVLCGNGNNYMHGKEYIFKTRFTTK